MLVVLLVALVKPSNKKAIIIIEQTIEFLNMLYFNLANFLEFDLVFKEFNYKFILNNQEFSESFELCIKFEEEYNGFLVKISNIRTNKIYEDLIKINENLKALEDDYQGKIKCYFQMFELKTLKNITSCCKYLNDNAFDEILKELLSLSKILSIEIVTKTNKILLFKELYMKAQENVVKLAGIQMSFEMLRRLNGNKYDVNQKKLNNIVGLNDFVEKFEHMGFKSWISFLQKLIDFLAEYFISPGKKEKKSKIDYLGDLKNISNTYMKDYSKMEIINLLINLISQVN